MTPRSCASILFSWLSCHSGKCCFFTHMHLYTHTCKDTCTHNTSKKWTPGYVWLLIQPQLILPCPLYLAMPYHNHSRGTCSLSAEEPESNLTLKPETSSCLSPLPARPLGPAADLKPAFISRGRDLLHVHSNSVKSAAVGIFTFWKSA